MKTTLFLPILLIVPACVLVITACNNAANDKGPAADSSGTGTPGAADPANANTAAGNRSTDHSMHGMTGDKADYCDSLNRGLLSNDTLKGSPSRSAMNTIGKTHVHIEYSSPGVKDRTIWGGLVAYDKVWVTGAHKATTIQLYRDIVFDGKTIPKGLYALFTIPGKTDWTFILNTRYDQHLADDYQEKEDLLRMTVRPVAHAFTPRLDYKVEVLDDTRGNIKIAWDRLALNIPFTTAP